MKVEEVVQMIAEKYSLMKLLSFIMIDTNIKEVGWLV